MTMRSQYREAAETLLMLSGVKSPDPALLTAIENVGDDEPTEDQLAVIGREFRKMNRTEDLRASIYSKVLRSGVGSDTVWPVYLASSAMIDSRFDEVKTGAFFLAATQAWPRNLPVASAG